MSNFDFYATLITGAITGAVIMYLYINRLPRRTGLPRYDNGMAPAKPIKPSLNKNMVILDHALTSDPIETLKGKVNKEALNKWIERFTLSNRERVNREDQEMLEEMMKSIEPSNYKYVMGIDPGSKEGDSSIISVYDEESGVYHTVSGWREDWGKKTPHYFSYEQTIEKTLEAIRNHNKFLRKHKERARRYLMDAGLIPWPLDPYFKSRLEQLEDLNQKSGREGVIDPGEFDSLNDRFQKDSI